MPSSNFDGIGVGIALVVVEVGSFAKPDFVHVAGCWRVRWLVACRLVDDAN